MKDNVYTIKQYHFVIKHLPYIIQSMKLCASFLFCLPKTPYVYEFIKKDYLTQIKPHYSLFNYNKCYDIFHYNTKYRRQFKNTFFKHSLVDNHHIIPKEFSFHPLMIEFQVDLSCSKNIMFLPNRSSKYIIEDNSIIYHTAHTKYNRYVENQLQYISSITDKESRQYQLSLFFYHLQTGLETNDPFFKTLFHKQ